jgi:hypothetical protein
VTVWHNAAHGPEGRHIAMLNGYQPGDPMVRVFTYQADAAGRTPEEIAEEAFAICNGHPPGAHADLTRRYYERELRSLSFPGNSSCCSRLCCLHHHAVWPSRRRGRRAGGGPASVSRVQGNCADDE